MADEELGGAAAAEAGTGEPGAAEENTNSNGAEGNSEAAATEGAAEGAAEGNSEAGAEGGSDEGSQSTPPEQYAEFELPEGMTADANLLEKATPVFQELGLSQEQAQKLVQLQAEHVQNTVQGQIDQHNQTVSDWLESAKVDKEFGGDKFDENVAIANAAIDKFGSPGLRELLDQYGVGNHPEIVRIMYRVGKLTIEDEPGGHSSAGASKNNSQLKRLYPND